MTGDRIKNRVIYQNMLKTCFGQGNFKVFLNTEVLYSIGFLQSLKHTLRK